MNQVYVRVSLDVIDEMKGFFSKLKAFVGDFYIMAQTPSDMRMRTVKILFHTDKVEIKEGDDKQVEIMAMNNEDGTWEFTHITK